MCPTIIPMPVRFPHYALLYMHRVHFKLYLLCILYTTHQLYTYYTVILCILYMCSTVRRVVFQVYIYRYLIQYNNNIRIARNRVLRVQILRKDNTYSIIYPFTTVRRTPTTRYDYT